MRPLHLSAAIYSLLFILLTESSCSNKSEIPFPEDGDEFSQPVAEVLKFSAPEKLEFSDSLTHIKLPSRQFDYDKLPTGLFDSAGFLPFPKPPAEISFDWNKLPEVPFDYDQLPSKPLKLQTQILPPPHTIKIGRSFRSKGAFEMLYEIGEPIIGKNITALLEDKNGFLWIATQDEVFRYNGEELAHYLNFPTVLNMLEDNTGRIWIASNAGNGIAIIDTKACTVSYCAYEKKAISRMVADKQNRIWLSSPTPPGLVTIIDPVSNTIKEIGPAQGLFTGNSNSTGMIEDDFGNLWIATRNGGINIIDFKNKKIKRLTKENGLSSDSLAAALLVKDNNKKVWASSYTGDIHSIDIQHGIIKRYSRDQGLRNDLVPSMMYSRDGNIWIGKQSGPNPKGGVEIIDPVNEKIKIIGSQNGLVSNSVTRLLQSWNGSVWIGTQAGLNMLPQKNDYSIRRIGNKDVSTQFEDANGKIWTGYLYDGIQVIDSARTTATYITTAQGISDNTIQHLLDVDGNMFVVNGAGIDILDFSRKKIESLGPKEGIRYPPQIAAKAPDGKIWIAVLGPGLEVFDPHTKTVYHVDSISGIKNSTVSNAFTDAHGDIWMGGSFGGIVALDTKSLTIRAINNIPSLKESVGNKVFLTDGPGNLWMGTSDNGVFMINAAKDSVTRFTVNEGLASNNINSLLEFNGRIFIGSNKGLTILTPPSALTTKWKTKSLGKSKGIEKEVLSVYSDLITRKGEYWWGDKGITILENTAIQDNDSIAPPIFINGISIQNRWQYYTAGHRAVSEIGDTIWNGTKDHFFVNGSIDGSNFFSTQGYIKMDSVAGIYNLPVNLEIPFADNYIQFHFLQMDPDHRNTDSIWYRYILEGIDKKWSERTENISSENYVHLQPGKYTFKVAAAFKGKWSVPVDFRFTVLPPWWETWWAYTLYLLGFIYVLWMFIKYRSRWLQKENRILEEKVVRRTSQLNKSIEELKFTQAQLIQSEKMASLGELTAGIAHEIQNPLNFVNNFSDVNKELLEELKEEAARGNIEEVKAIANDVIENSEKINHHGKRADSIVKGMLQHSRTSTNQKELTDINALADEFLRLAYHGLRGKDNSFNVTMKTDFDETIGKINIIPQDIGRVLLNLYNNAFYATNEKKKIERNNYEPVVLVSTKKVDDKIAIRVKDNGNGVPQNLVDKIFQPFFTTKPTGQGTGLGLSLSYDIIKAHGGGIKVETKESSDDADNPQGSTFIIHLPII